MAKKETSLDQLINRVSTQTNPGSHAYRTPTQPLQKAVTAGIQWYVMENAANGWRVYSGPFTSEQYARDAMEGWMRTSPHYKITTFAAGDTPG